MKKTLFFLLAVLGLHSCVSPGPGSRLNDVESLLRRDLPGSGALLRALERDTGAMSVPDRARYHLFCVDLSYRRHRRVPSWHLSVAGSLLSSSRSPSSPRALALYHLFSGVSSYDSGSYDSSLGHFRQVERHESVLGDPYLLGLFHGCLGRLYFLGRSYSRSHEHFRLELYHARALGDACRQSRSEHHYALSFLALGDLDSCRYYLGLPLSYLPLLGEEEKMMVYHNVAYFNSRYGPGPGLPEDYYYAMSLSCCRNRPDSVLVMTHQLYAYFVSGEWGKGAPLFSWLSSRGCGLSQFHYCGYLLCRASGSYPASYRWHDAYQRVRTSRLSHPRWSGLVPQEDKIRVSPRGKRPHPRLLYVLAFTLLFPALLLPLLFRKRRRARELTAALSAQRAESAALRRSLAASRTLAHRQSSDLEEAARARQRLRAEADQEHALLVEYRSLVGALSMRHMLKKESATFCGRDFTHLVEEYGRSSDVRREFIVQLRSLPVSLSPRDLYICILYYESGVPRSEMAFILGINSKTAFKSAKCKVKAKLLSQPAVTPELRRLLKNLE